jgi:hypothetical protein
LPVAGQKAAKILTYLPMDPAGEWTQEAESKLCGANILPQPP